MRWMSQGGRGFSWHFECDQSFQGCAGSRPASGATCEGGGTPDDRADGRALSRTVSENTSGIRPREISGREGHQEIRRESPGETRG